jgi:hypothetical protein
MSGPAACPDPARWHQLLAGELPEQEQAALHRHLEACSQCQQLLEKLTAGGETWAGAARHLAGAEPEHEPALKRVMAELEAEANQGERSPDTEETLDFLGPPERPEQLGRLGHYAVSEVLGRGGMGIVLKAFDEQLHRVVAIKVMAPQLATSATARRRFVREARAAAAVRNDHVIDIHAVDEAGPLPYLVMEYVSGVSLQQRLNRTGPLQLAEILRIGMQTATGLAAAHAQGLVHRDIKPANILLENGVERVKLTDFGLARTVDDVGLTHSGVVAGTPSYMAPEQARGETVDHRADLFSLGSVLYALCTGRSPFGGGNSFAILKRVCEETACRASQANPEIPDWLSDIVARLLDKDPSRRFQSASEVAELLKNHLARVQQSAVVPKSSATSRARAGGRGRWRAIAVIGVLCALTALALIEATGVTGITATLIRMRPHEPERAVATPRVEVPAPVGAEPPEGGTPTPAWFDAALPAEAQVKAVAARLKTLNPGFDGEVTSGIFGGEVRRLEFDGKEVADLSPVRALAGLKGLYCWTDQPGKLRDLSPLKGLVLRGLDCRNSQVADLSPLQGMPLEILNLHATQISDLAPLKEMPLTTLTIGKTAVKDLAPLKGMPLKMLHVHDTGVTDLSPLAGMPLETLYFGNTEVGDLSPLKGMPLRVLSCRDTQVRDLSPLRGMDSLQQLNFHGSKVLDSDVVQKNLEVLRSLKGLTRINDQPAAEFLKRGEQVPDK